LAEVVLLAAGYDMDSEWVRLLTQSQNFDSRSDSSHGFLKQLALHGVRSEARITEEYAAFHFTMLTHQSSDVLRLLCKFLNEENSNAETKPMGVFVNANSSVDKSGPWQQGLLALDEAVWGAGASKVNESPTEFTEVSRSRSPILAPRRLALCYWNSSPIQSDLDQIRESLEVLQNRAVEPIVRRPSQPPRFDSEVKLINTSIAEPYLLMGQGFTIDGSRTYLSMQVLAHVLGGMQSGRLPAVLQSETQSVYTVEVACYPKSPDQVTLRIACQSPRPAEVRRIIRREIQRISQGPISDDEFSRGVSVVRSRILLDHESPRGQIVRRAIALLLQQPPPPTTAELVEIVERLTIEDLRETARSLKPEQFATILVGRNLDPRVFQE
jgi:hypothetical protein